MKRLPAAGMILGMLLIPGSANATVIRHHHHVMTCHRSDWGNTMEYHGKWYICNPSRHGFTWQEMPPGRQMAS